MDWSDSRRETVEAAIASVLLHLALILCVALALSIPAWQYPVTPPESDAPIEITMMPVEAAKPEPPSYVATPGPDVADAPKNAPFESDKNTRAASESAPSGTAALPSIDGRESTSIELVNRDYSEGKQGVASTPRPPQADDQSPPPEAVATPVPSLPAATQLALREAPPRPKNEELRKPSPPAQPMPPAAPGFQPQTRITRIKGNISNRGKASVDAAATPLGRYKKMVSDAIGSRWYYYVNDQIGLLNIGTVEIRFVVASDGKVGKVKVLSNTSNESFASVSVNSIIEAEIPPIPEDVAKLLDNGRIEIDYSFTILSN